MVSVPGRCVREGCKGLQTPPPPCPHFFVFLACLSERSVMYEDTHIPCLGKWLNLIDKGKKSAGSPPPPPPPPRRSLTYLSHCSSGPQYELICIQPIRDRAYSFAYSQSTAGDSTPRYKLVRPPLLSSTARGAVGKATCSSALHCLFSGCKFKSSCCLFFLL